MVSHAPQLKNDRATENRSAAITFSCFTSREQFSFHEQVSDDLEARLGFKFLNRPQILLSYFHGAAAEICNL
jgi:hypothetical protein